MRRHRLPVLSPAACSRAQGPPPCHACLLDCRADELEIVRRVPLEGHAVTFLLTGRHLRLYRRGALLDFICSVRVLGWWVLVCGLLM